MPALRAAPILLALLLVSGCGGGDRTAPGASPAESGERPRHRVAVVNYPLQYFTERIGGDLVQVSFPLPDGVDPASWSPGAEVVTDFQEADLILRNGAGYAAWIDRVSLPPSRLVDTSAAFQDRLLREAQAVTHTHGPGGEHSHEGIAGTTWLDPGLAREQALAVTEALVRLWPEDEARLRSGYAALAADLEALDRRLQAVAERMRVEPLLFSHPVYQYLIAHLGLDARELHWEPGEVPDEQAFHALDHLLESHPARLLVWEAEPLAETRRELEKRGIASVVFAIAAAPPASGDYLSVMAENAARLERAFPPS